MDQIIEAQLKLLSTREFEIMEELSNGRSREQIASKFNISVLTYDGYRKNIRQKLSIANRMDWSRWMVYLENQKRE